MKLRNINPLGAVDLPLVGRVLEPGEVFEVDDTLAGRAPSTSVDEDSGEEVHDLGSGLLAQVGNFEQAGAKDPLGPPVPTEEWSKAQLLEAATRRGIDVAPTAKKADIVAALTADATPAPEEDQ
ncbi:hypothetical protein ACK8HX_02075 [Oryzobacter sp. R7]|uniref:hypothetical protein n=1 Tax=Oryzobacter faecalis TaxID=3388656 RepID=UPI00398C8916